MLEHKAVGKRPSLKLFIFIVALALFNLAAKEKTVGDLLKGIESRAVKLQKRQKIALPKFNQFPTSRKKVNLDKVEPPARSKLYYDEGTDEAELEQVTDAGIRQMFKLTTKFKKSSKRGELWLRLAELYVEKSRLIEFRLQAQYDEQLKAFADKKTKKKPRINLTPSQDYNKKAIQLYEWFLRDFPKDSKIDQALFFLGYNYFEIGNENKGKSYYERLAKEFPRSPYVEETNFVLGEYYFEKRQWKNSLEYYQKVTRNKRARLYSFALYKSAWSYYKMGKPKTGLARLEQVIRVGRLTKGRKDRSSGGVSRIRLASEAIRDLVIFFADARDFKTARPYFRNVVGRKSVNGVLEKLAYYYAGRGYKTQARYTFQGLIDSSPNSPKSYDYQYQIVLLYSAAGNDKIFREELYKWIEGYGPESVWARANDRNKSLVRKASELIETTLRNYVLQQHQTAQNSRASYSQKMAKNGYELYFDTFKKSSKLSEMHFFYAELLFDLKDFERAAFHYLWVADNDPKSQYFNKSILNAILALEKKLPSAAEIKKIVGKSLEPVEFDRTIRAFVRTSNRYVKEFPKAKDAIAIKYRVGSLHYYYNQFDKAIPIFKDIIRDHSESEYAEYSANLLLDIYNLKKDFKGLTLAGEQILANPKLANSPIGKKVKKIIERAAFKQAEEMEKGKDHLKAAKAYENFAKKHPRTEFTITSYFNAGVNYEKAGDLFKAAAMYNIVAGSISKKNQGLRKKTKKFLAGIYQKTGQYQKAARAFEAYAAKHPDDKDSVNYYFNAAVIRDGLNHYKTALRNYQIYFDKSKKSDRIEVLFLMGKIWQKRGNLYRAMGYYEKYISSNPRNPARVVEAAFTVAKLNGRVRRTTKAKEWYIKTVLIQRRLAKKGENVGVAFAAEAQFKIIYKTYREFSAIRLPRNPKSQRTALNKKINLLNRLKEELKTVIRYDDGPMVVASLATLGMAWQGLNSTILRAPLPKGLDADGMKIYKIEVAKVAEPSRKEAIAAYKSAIDKSFSIESYNDYTKTAIKNINALDPVQYKYTDERALLTKVPDWMKL